MKLSLTVRLSFLLICWLCFETLTGVAHAQTITINQPLRFGQFVMADNGAPRSIALMAGGGFTADPQYIFFVNPQLGNVTLSGYAPSTTYTVTLGTNIVTHVGPGTARFVTSSPFTDPAVITTDGTGSVTFDVGATLTSDGGGTTHLDGTYNGTFTVTVTP